MAARENCLDAAPQQKPGFSRDTSSTTGLALGHMDHVFPNTADAALPAEHNRQTAGWVLMCCRLMLSWVSTIGLVWMEIFFFSPVDASSPVTWTFLAQSVAVWEKSHFCLYT